MSTISAPRGSLFNNIAAGGGANLFKVVVQLAMLPLMGRLLGPKEFGVYAVVLPIVTFFAVVADGGLGVSLAREKASEKLVWSTSFYLMIVVGALLCITVEIIGFILSLMVKEPRILPLMMILSVSFLMIGISVLPAARLVRDNDLVSLAGIDIIGTIFGAIVAVAFALTGFGAFSLAFQYVSSYSVRAVCLNYIAFEFPSWEFSLGALGKHINTGGVLVSARLLDLLCRLGENVLFTWAFGPVALGAYSFANQVSRFLCEAASNPIWSALYAQALREPPTLVPSLLAKMTRLMSIATFPLACLVTAAAPQVLHYLLGERWNQAGPLIQLLIPSYAIVGVASMAGAVLLANNFNKEFFALFAALSLGRVGAVACGPFVGAVGAVCLIGIVHLFYCYATLEVMKKTMRIRVDQIFTSGPFASGFLGGAACFLMLTILPGSLASTVVSIILGLEVFLADLFLLEGKRLTEDVIAVWRTVSMRR